MLFQLQDGIVVFWLKDVATLNQTHTVIMIDANGSRGPNKKGYDVFLFVKDYNKNKIIMVGSFLKIIHIKFNFL